MNGFRGSGFISGSVLVVARVLTGMVKAVIVIPVVVLGQLQLLLPLLQ